MTASFSDNAPDGMRALSPGAAEEVFIFPVSFAQERLWFLDQFEPNSPFYNIPAAINFPGALNLTALQQSLDEIVRRHEALRTSFASHAGQTVQVIHPPAPLPLPLTDLRRLPPSQRQPALDRLATAEAQRPFDLRRGPLLRAHLVRRHDHDHLLLLTMHHIISDGWSMGLFFRELATLYAAPAHARTSTLPPLPIQYADFAQWQRTWLQGARLTRLLAYWRAQLTGAPPALALPTDHPRPPVQSFRGATQMFSLGAAVTSGLKALAQASGVTLFMLLVAAFQTLLSRYTGQEDVVVGTPIANRNRSETEGLIGFFVNTLVLRTGLTGDPSFRRLLERVREVTLGAYEHQDLPFERLVEELQPERTLNQNPLVQVLFSLQNAPTLTTSGSAQAALEAMEQGPQLGTSRFDLALFTEEREQELLAGFEYATDLFEPPTIARMAGHFQTLLEAIVANPNHRLSELRILPETEQRQLQREWNETESAYMADACVQQLFEMQVAQRADETAVIIRERSWTYREVNQRANQLAHYLRQLGIGPEARVGLCMGRSMEMVVGLLGVLKAGGAYVPLDMTYPKERLAFVIADSQIRILLTEQRLHAELPTQDVEVVCLDTDWAVSDPAHTENPVNVTTPDNLAYIIYTSGSTGQPKGVAMPHRALVNLLWWQTRRSPLANQARTLQLTSLSFDVSFQEIFSTWLTGGTLILAPEEARRDAAKLLQCLKDFSIERLFLPPVALQQLAEALVDTPPPANLRQIITAGEQLQITPPITRLCERLARCALHNHYGPSESHVVTTLTLEGAPADWPAAPSIGRPIANTQIFILDAKLQLMPVGMPGELYIGGVSLSRGYLDRPALTAERFIPHPYSAERGARLYKTGDLARYRPDGNIEFLGRSDRQVKIRGFRIELGEIEAVLTQHPLVREVVAVARPTAAGDTGLVTYLVPDAGTTISSTELRRFLKEKLPEYMLPAAFVQLDALPLTPSGKVDRRALPAPDGQRPEMERVYIAPRTPVEKALAKIWSDILGVERVGVHDNFFELGGHSLLATQVVSRVRAELQVELPLRRLFEAPTVAELVVGVVLSRAEQAGQEDLSDLLAELEYLSEDQVRALLDDET
jgi:amino acid adenylation domain-containing protein